MRFVCDSCRAQYMISDEKVGAKGVKVRCKKCGYVILVRRPQDVPTPPVDEPGSDATQVMDNPLVAAAASANSGTTPFDPEVTNPGGAPGDGGIDKLFGGVEEDEIGAVFDQVLSGKAKGGEAEGGGSVDPFGDPSGGALGDDDDDRMSTRVLDAEVVKKLAAESGARAVGEVPAEEKAPEPEKNDWFVAIDDKQVGPLDLDKLKEHWDAGEIGPDSLCWRAGFSDWTPLSEIAGLASVLAPQPKKPVIVAPVETPLDASGSAGGTSRSARGDQVAGATTNAEDTGWKPSAASALASLVKEEIEALAKPAAPAKPEPAAEPEKKKADRPAGLLDVPSAEFPVPEEILADRAAFKAAAEAKAERKERGVSAEVPSSPVGPAPYTTTFRAPTPEPKSSKAVVYIGAAALIAVLVAVGAVAWMVLNQNEKLEEIARKPAEVPAPVVVAKAEPPPAPKSPEPVAPAAPEPAAATEAKAETAPAVAEAPKTEPESTKAEAAPEPEKVEPKREAQATSTKRTTVARRDPEPRREPEPEPVRRESAPAASEGNDDDFESIFGAKPAGKKQAEPKKDSARAVYVPPAPGSADIPDKLGQSDVMQVVLANRPAIMNCVNEQKQKDPGASGTLVMRWTIRTNGSTSGISPQTAEYKSSHLAGCMTGLIKKWKFPAHKTQGAPIDFPFKF